MKLIKQLRWRYAVKRMNGHPVPTENLHKILESIRLAPTSMGLQPFQIIVIEDQNVKEDLYKNGCSQPQILECSHLLVFCGWNSVSEIQVDAYMESIAETRNIDVNLLVDFKQSILNFTSKLSTEKTREWSARQIYLALGTAIDAAALSHVDTTPMEGFDSQAIDEYFQLDESDLHSVVLLALGYRDEHKDEFANFPKVRREFNDIFKFI